MPLMMRIITMTMMTVMVVPSSSLYLLSASLLLLEDVLAVDLDEVV